MCHLNQACPNLFVRGPNKGFFSYLRAAQPWIYHGNMMTVIYLGMALTCIIIDYTLQKNNYIFYFITTRFACLRCATGGHFVSARGVF